MAGVNLELEVSRQKEEDKESKTRQHAAIKKERREDKWTEIKHSQTDRKKGTSDDSDCISNTPKLKSSRCADRL